MKRFLKITLEIILGVIESVIYFVKNNLRNFTRILSVLLPYIMLFVGQIVYSKRGFITIGSEIFIPILFGIIIYFIRSFANKIGKGIDVPVPEKRFTEVDNDGEVNILNERLPELILYTADLEDWLERKKLLK